MPLMFSFGNPVGALWFPEGGSTFFSATTVSFIFARGICITNILLHHSECFSWKGSLLDSVMTSNQYEPHRGQPKHVAAMPGRPQRASHMQENPRNIVFAEEHFADAADDTFLIRLSVVHHSVCPATWY